MIKKYIYLSIAMMLFSVMTMAQQNQQINNTNDTVEEDDMDDIIGRINYEMDLLVDPATKVIPTGVFEAAHNQGMAARHIPQYNNNHNQLVFQPLAAATPTPAAAGPGNLGGRTRALAYAKGFGVTNQLMMAGCVSGGVFRSANGGGSWRRVNGLNNINNITCIAQDPRPNNQQTWYLGTGEAIYNSANVLYNSTLYIGNGVYKSIDSGYTWVRLPSSDTGVAEAFDVREDYISRIVVTPDSGWVYIAALGCIERSKDGGATWQKVLIAGTLNQIQTPAVTNITDVICTDSGRIYATLPGTADIGGSAGVYMSIRGDTGTYVKIGGASAPANTVGWPADAGYGRIVIAVAPSADSILYALMWNGVTTGNAISGSLFVRNGNAGWTDLSANLPNESPGANNNAWFDCFSGYCLTIAVKPNDPNFVVIGGVNAYRSTDGFATAANYTRIGGYATAANYTAYLNHHSDQQIMVFQPGSPTVLTTGDDGGIQRTDNVTAGVVAWNSLNNNYQTYQYYYVAIDPTVGSTKYLGGAQDNGTTSRDSGTNNWRPVWGGDGGSVGISCGNAFQYVSSQSGRISRRASTLPFQSGTNIKPAGSGNGLFVTLFYLDPDNTEDLYYASNNSLYRTTNASTVTTVGWTSLTGVAATVGGGTNITSLATTRGPYNANHKLFIGTNNAKIYRLDNPQDTLAALNPQDISPAAAGADSITPGSVVIGIAVGPRNGDTVLAVVSNYNAVSVFWTGNANANAPVWRNVEGNLTLPSFRSCAIVPTTTGFRYFVGTSVGLYSTDSVSGNTTAWVREAADTMGEALVSSLVVRPNDNTLLIGTHGNGAYVTNIANPLPSAFTDTLVVFPFRCLGSNIVNSFTGSSTNLSYLWNDGSTDINRNLVGPGTWSVTVTDAPGCVSVRASVVTTTTLAPVIQLTAFPFACYGSNIAITATQGLGSNTYLWNDSTTDAFRAGVGAGTYSVTATDQEGCTGTASITTTQASAPSISLTVFSFPCYGSNIAVTASGGTGFFSYKWNDSTTNVNRFGVGPGTYSVTATDSAGCTATASVTTTQATGPNMTLTVFPFPCIGSNIVITTTGGTGVISYLWSNGSSNVNQNLVRAGTYTVTATDSAGCSSTASITTTASAGPSITLSSGLLNCFNLSITVDTSGGSGVLNYLWNDGSTAMNRSFLTAGTYLVTVTDSAGCSATDSITVTQPSPLSVNTSSTGTTCNQNNGSVTATPSGGTPPYRYMWNTINNDTTQTVTGLSPGQYLVTVTDSNGCIEYSSVFINPAPSIGFSTSTYGLILCNGGTTSACITFTGGMTPYHYQWSYSINNTDTTCMSNLIAGTYTVTATDSSGCTATGTIIITQPNPLNCSSVGSNASCALNDGIIGVSSTGGTSPYMYSKNNGITFQPGDSLFGLTAGTYTVLVRDNNGCTCTSSVTISQVNGPIHPYINSGGVNAICPGGIVTFNTGSYNSYLWSNGRTNQIMSVTTAGTYCVTVTQSQGCSGTACMTIGNNPPITVNGSQTPASCNQSNGTATANVNGGTSPFNYIWSNGQTTRTATGLMGGNNYSVTITDFNGCTGATSVPISNTQILVTASATPEMCTEFNGTATANVSGGNGPYTYMWSNGGTNQTITGLGGGSYSVTATDSGGCTGTASVIVNSFVGNLSASCTANNEICNSQNGTASVNATGGTSPYTYLWSDGQFSQTATGLSSGSYAVTVTDSVGCTATCESLVANSQGTISVNSSTTTGASCNQSNGTATPNPSGGTTPYTYLWSNGQTGATSTGLSGLNTYTVTITDANGCTGTTEITILSFSYNISVTSTSTSDSCETSNGTATVTASGGNSPYIFLWSDGQTGQTAVGLSGGNYTVTVTDSNGCTGTAFVGVSIVHAPPTPIITETDGGCSGSTLSVQLFSSYLWSNGSIAQTTTITSNGDYSITVSNLNGCTASASITATTATVPLNITLTVTQTQCNGSNIVVTTTGGTGLVTYVWNDLSTIVNRVGVGLGIWTVTGTDQNGCTATASVTTTSYAPLYGFTSIFPTPPAPCGGNTVSYSVGGGSPTFKNYLWSNGATNSLINGLAAGTYTVTVTDSVTGCTITGTAVATGPAPLLITLTTFSNCNGSNITVTTTGGTGIVSYTWNDGSHIVNRIGVGPGTWSVTGTDQNGCTATASVTTTTVSVNASITGPSTICSGSQAILNAGSFASYHWSNGATSASITVTAAGNYMVTVTNASGCTGTASKIVTVTTLLAPSITANGPTSFCQGGSVVLSVGAYSTYNWSTGATGSSITATSSGSYVVTVSNGAGCTGSTMKTVTVTVLPVPSITVSGNLCSSTTATLTVGSFTTYLWNNAATTQSITVSTGGNYSITVTNVNGCSGTAATTVAISACVPPANLSTTNIAATTAVANWVQPSCYSAYAIQISKHNLNTWTTYAIAPNTHYTFSALTRNTVYDWQIMTFCNASHTNSSPWSAIQTFSTLSAREDGDGMASEDLSDLQAYPNPTNGLLNIVFNSDVEGAYSLRLMDVTGRIILNEDHTSVIGENQYQMNLSEVAKGIYMILFQQGDAVLQTKIVVQ